MLHARKKKIQNSRILIVGIAYKKDVKDLRESPAINIIKLLRAKRAKVSYYDPLFPYFEIRGIDMKPVQVNAKTLKKFDCTLLITDHTKLDYRLLAKNSKAILDTRNIFYKLGIKSKNIIKL